WRAARKKKRASRPAFLDSMSRALVAAAIVGAVVAAPAPARSVIFDNRCIGVGVVVAVVAGDVGSVAVVIVGLSVSRGRAQHGNGKASRRDCEFHSVHDLLLIVRRRIGAVTPYFGPLFWRAESKCEA